MAKNAIIVIEDEKNDDWMKSLPGYQDEVKIHESLKFDKPKKKDEGKKSIIVQVEGVKGGSGSGNYGHAGRPGMIGGSGGRGRAISGGIKYNRLEFDHPKKVISGMKVFVRKGESMYRGEVTHEINPSKFVVSCSDRSASGDYGPSDLYVRTRQQPTAAGHW